MSEQLAAVAWVAGYFVGAGVTLALLGALVPEKEWEFGLLWLVFLWPFVWFVVALLSPAVVLGWLTYRLALAIRSRLSRRAMTR